VTLSGWVVKLGSWWDDGHETNFYVGDKDTTLSSHFQISGSAQIAPGWSAGYTIAVETPGDSASVGFCENQYNDNCAAFGSINTLLSYMWLKSDKWGTINWGQLSQATDNVALLPDLSGTVIESNAVVFDGPAMFVRPKGTRNSNDLSAEFAWNAVLTCNTAGGGLGADCNGYPQNAFRYDSPTWGGFSMSTSYGEDDMWDIALKYAADWNSVKFSAAAGYTQLTDEGCGAVGITCTNGAISGGGGAPHQNYRQDGQLFQVGASIMHVPSGLFVYGLYQNDQEDGTQYRNFNFNTGKISGSSASMDTDTWFVKAGIKRTFSPVGATVIWGEWGQYNDMFRGLCGTSLNAQGANNVCTASLVTGVASNGDAITTDAVITGSQVTRYGVGVVQEIDSAAMHLFARWQHLDLDLNATNAQTYQNIGCHGYVFGGKCFGKEYTYTSKDKNWGKSLSSSWEGLDIFQIGGVIFF